MVSPPQGQPEWTTALAFHKLADLPHVPAASCTGGGRLCDGEESWGPEEGPAAPSASGQGTLIGPAEAQPGVQWGGRGE